jgi:hypothetical protein
MADKVELDIGISPEGLVKVHIKGMRGKKCLDLAKKLEKSLGRITEQRYTPEYYEHEEKSALHGRI